MTRPSILWRLILRAEAFLPSPSRATTTEKRSRGWWIAFVAVLPSVVVALARVARERLAVAQLWVTWAPMFRDLILLVAAATLVAAAAAGLHAWNRADA